MASTTFVSKSTVIPAAWLNDVNTVVYTYFGTGSVLNSPTKLTVAQGVFTTSITVPTITAPTGNFLTVGTDDTSDLRFKANGSTQWFVQGTTGNILPNTADSLNIGSQTNRVLNIVSKTLNIGLKGLISETTTNNVTNGSAQTIYTVQSGGKALLLICGITGANDQFTDIVISQINGGTPNTLGSVTNGTPGARTYTSGANAVLLNPATTMTRVRVFAFESNVNA